jgi:predicted TIM-barrel fold metal-dependent hydrolase
MDIDDLILVSVDDHIIEPPTMWDGKLPAKFQDKAPKMVTRDDGAMVWVYEGTEIPNIALNAVAGRPKEELGFEPTSLDELRPGCYDATLRVKDMDANGVLGSMGFPSFVRFAGQLFMHHADREQSAAMVRAYNDWHIDEWCGSAPGRFIPLAIPMLWDPEATAAEVRRNAARGCHAMTFTSNPAALGLPSVYTDHWDPVWQACVETRTVVCMHLGSSSQTPTTGPDAPIEVIYTLSPINLFECAADLLWSPMFRRFPELRVALSEGGTGWVPYFLERVDYIYNHTRPWTHTDLGGKLPSEIFKEHVLLCFIDDAVGIETRGHLNLDHIMWECDFPHSDSTWPLSPEVAIKYLGDLPDDEVNRITHLNAIRAFSYDPFDHVPKAEATVGALRRKAEGWDVSPKPAAVQRASRTVSLSSINLTGAPAGAED